jgi:AraC-like DNA-binding protein
MHERPTDAWTLELLADRVGLSRSALHERFVQFIGMPPMQYLTNWRMQIASRLLTQGNASMASIALDSGYESEAAFSRAFKRAVGVPPSVWRRQKTATSLSPSAPQAVRADHAPTTPPTGASSNSAAETAVSAARGRGAGN